ncbi:MAG: MFS transporter, partial [Nocardioides sp.]
ITRSRSGLSLVSPRPGRSSGASSGAGGGAGRSPAADRLSAAFYQFSAACAAITLGLMTFGVIGYHLADADLVPVAAVPLVYAGAMAAEAIAALVTGFVYDRVGGAVLLVLPILVAPLPALVFAPKLAIVLGGVAIWGAASGIADSTVKALVADLVARERLATSYGVFAAIQGGAALAGGALAGLLYAEHLAVLVAVVAGAQVVALLVLRRVLHAR